MRLCLLALTFAAVAFLATAGACQGAYVTGLYWVEDDIYYLDLTLHNNEPGDEWRAYGLIVKPGGFDAQAPEDWAVRALREDLVSWAATGEGVPPGEALSGFALQTRDLADEYLYKIHGDHNWAGHFTPEYIPWPPATGPAVLVILGLWAARRHRRRS
jgi:hypothetical protein